MSPASTRPKLDLAVAVPASGGWRVSGRKRGEAAVACGGGEKTKDMKLAYHMAKWIDGGDGKLTQAQFNLKYSVCHDILNVGRKGIGGVTLTSSLVRGRMC